MMRVSVEPEMTIESLELGVPMHTFGHPADLDGLCQVAAAWGLVLVEDAAESLGSLYRGKHTGTFGKIGA